VLIVKTVNMHFHFGQEHMIFFFLLSVNKFGISRFIEDVKIIWYYGVHWSCAYFNVNILYFLNLRRLETVHIQLYYGQDHMLVAIHLWRN